MIYITHQDDNSELIFMGDFNCEMSSDTQQTLSTKTTMLQKFLQHTGLISANMKDICIGPMYTYDPLSDHRVTSMIDHILIDQNIESWLTICLIIDSDGNPSDHLPVLIELEIKIKIEISTPYDKGYIQWNKMNDKEIHSTYTLSLPFYLNSIKKPCLGQCDLHQLEEYYGDIVSSLKSCASNTIGFQKPKPGCKPFWCKQLDIHYRNMGACRKDWNNAGKPREHGNITYTTYKEAKRLFRKEMRERQIMWEKRNFDKIEQSSELDQQTFWRLIKRKRQKAPPQKYDMKFSDLTCSTSQDICNGWKRYFSELYSHLECDNFNPYFKQKITKELQQMKGNKIGYCHDLDKPISLEEIQEAVKSLPMKKAGGHDTLTNEYIKYGGIALYQHLELLYSIMINIGKVPGDMKRGLMITLLKPGKKNKSSPDSYRGITLLPVLYKLFEKITLTRMKNFLMSIKMVFPDPLQCAYQKKLSSLNATYSIQETINYNTERGSKVFMCLMDNKKAFDIVWHNGLFVKLYRLGICNKLWRLIINAYTGIMNTVLYDGIESDPFEISQSTRQGSMWGAFFYLVFANSLIKEIRDLDKGAYVHNIFSGIHMQADDIALLATSRKGLQIMMDQCYEYSCKWRFIIHPGKSVVMVCGENKQKLTEAPKDRNWHIGSQTIDEVINHEHCGILLSNSRSSVARTKTACRKGRGIMSSLCRQEVLGHGDMNPLTYLKLYRTITLTSALFGCELWQTLSKTEKDMLERMQRYCAKIIQKFSRRTRSNICCKMLGLQSIESYIDAAKLKFWRRLNDLPSYAVSKQIFLQRLFQAILMPGFTSGRTINTL